MSAVWNLAGSEGTAPQHLPGFPPLDQSMDVDVVVVGGGITGVTTALRLAEAGERVALLEAHRIASGSTGGSTGNLYGTVSQGLSSLHRKWDQDTVNRVVSLRREAVDAIEEKVRRFGIDCQFERCPLHLCIEDFASGSAESELKMLEQEQAISEAAGLKTRLLQEPDDLGLASRCALLIDGQAQFNPLRYCEGLARAAAEKGAAIFEQSPVVEVNAGEGKVRTANGSVVRAGHIVFATHTPKGINMLQAEMEVYREHGVAAPLEGSAKLPPGIFWVQDSGHSLRVYRYQGQQYLVVIGSKHETGHGDLGEGYFEQLADYGRGLFPIDQVSHRWSAQQYRSADLLPYIGHSGHDNVYVATGFAADGLTWGEVAAQLLADQILGRKQLDGQLLNPRRFTPAKSAKSWLETNTKVAKHLSTDRFSVEKAADLNTVLAGEGKVVKVDGENYAIYRSAAGELSALSPLCPHMKCMVNWNSADKSWDCPCHGSRFSPEGEVIEGPAYKPLAKRDLPL